MKLTHLFAAIIFIIFPVMLATRTLTSLSFNIYKYNKQTEQNKMKTTEIVK